MKTSEAHDGQADGHDPRQAAVILVDTNVFVDLWTGDATWADWSEEALARAAELPISSSAPTLSSTG